jgi:hypothetical protein
MSERTAGPYKYWVCHAPGEPSYGVVHNGETRSSGVEIARVKTNGTDGILLAAAWDLLDALIFAREEIAMRVKEDGGDEKSVAKACRKLDAAIAKAGGEQS